MFLKTLYFSLDENEKERILYVRYIILLNFVRIYQQTSSIPISITLDENRSNNFSDIICEAVLTCEFI